MNDLISRQAAIDLFPNDVLEWDTFDGYIAPHVARRLIEDLPSAQPEPEEDCDTCKHGYFGDSQCNNCRVRFLSHYEREEEYHGSD